ncbi:hypothetical protein NKH19_00730 [Mesorhizobium sp. M1338]|uniref:primase-helicase family protein n=1 Tax=unclassified Mesorhizobium TaxID=325217 RepID=UPI00333756D9
MTRDADEDFWDQDELQPWEIESPQGVRLEDFFAYMPQHRFIFAPTRELWPASSVNSRLPPMMENGEKLSASAWLDRHQPVEQLTWFPGEPMIIRDKLVAEGGFIDRSGSTIFNLYRPPGLLPGRPELAGPWLEHVRAVYPDNAEHIIRWLAHRVQKPGEKINHALLLGGPPGIGKDTLLHPVVHAVGAWNFAEVSPPQLLGRFNGFFKSVILRVNEARDLGEIDRFAFYEHCKPLTAAPPEVLRCDEKNIREHSVLNVVGVIITSNYLTDGCYLPPDDRRHYVAWSKLPAAGEPGALDSDYFQRLYRWYDEGGGNGHVAAYLREFDLSDFNAKAPPPKTAAFWEIVDANRSSGESEFSDAIDKMTEGNGGRPPIAFSTDKLTAHLPEPLATWVRDQKNRRIVPVILEKIGYVRVQNPHTNNHLWKINQRRQVVYGLRSLSERARLDAAMDLYSSGEA